MRWSPKSHEKTSVAKWNLLIFAEKGKKLEAKADESVQCWGALWSSSQTNNKWHFAFARVFCFLPPRPRRLSVPIPAPHSLELPRRCPLRSCRSYGSCVCFVLCFFCFCGIAPYEPAPFDAVDKPLRSSQGCEYSEGDANLERSSHPVIVRGLTWAPSNRLVYFATICRNYRCQRQWLLYLYQYFSSPLPRNLRLV